MHVLGKLSLFEENHSIAGFFSIRLRELYFRSLKPDWLRRIKKKSLNCDSDGISSGSNVHTDMGNTLRLWQFV